MFIKTVSLTTKRISMEHTSIRNSREKWIKNQNPKEGQKGEERIRSRTTQKYIAR